MEMFTEKELKILEEMEEKSRIRREKKYEEFKEYMLQYDDFSEEELKEMFEAEMIAEFDI